MDKIRSINPEQVASLVRTILQIVGAVLATGGYFTETEWAAISGPLLALVVTGWGFWARSDRNLIRSAALVPAVEKIVTPAAGVARGVNDPKVQPR